MTDFVTKSTLKSRGWTDAKIRDWLGEPDKYSANKHNPSAPLHLFSHDRVAEIEQSNEFTAWVKASATKRANQSKAKKQRADTARNELLEYVNSIEITLPHYGTKQALIDDAIAHYERLNALKNRKRTLDYSQPKNIERICTNYLRHHCTQYEDILASIAGKTGIDDAYLALKQRINATIAEFFDQF